MEAKEVKSFSKSPTYCFLTYSDDEAQLEAVAGQLQEPAAEVVQSELVGFTQPQIKPKVFDGG